MSDRIFLYALSTCSHCKRTRQLLDDYHVDYDYLYVDLCEGEARSQAIAEVKEYNPNCTFPTLVVGDKIVIGYKEQEIKEALGIK